MRLRLVGDARFTPTMPFTLFRLSRSPVSLLTDLSVAVLSLAPCCQPNHCLNTTCENRQRWILDTSLSSFSDWQLVRIQENSHEIPAGSMPRSMKIVLRHECVELAKPGDKCTFTGSLIVVPDISQLG